MSDVFALRSGGRIGLHPTASSSEMQPEENWVSKSSDELQSMKSSLYLLKYVLETFTFSQWKILVGAGVVTGRLLLNDILILFIVSIIRGRKNELFMIPNRKLIYWTETNTAKFGSLCHLRRSWKKFSTLPHKCVHTFIKQSHSWSVQTNKQRRGAQQVTRWPQYCKINELSRQLISTELNERQQIPLAVVDEEYWPWPR